MARVTYVKRAQQRYHTKPVIDPATGKQKQTPVMRRNGEQKVTKRGSLVFLRVTERDLDRPRPLLRCDFPGCETPEIQIGTAYKHVTPKSGPYGGVQRNRHASHPSWQPWELSQSLGARLAQISHDFWEASPFNDPSDVTSALESAAESIREIAGEKEEGADNIEEGFGHETSQSSELRETAESLNGWADDIEQVDVPELPDIEDRFFVYLKDGDTLVGDEEGYETEAEAESEARDEYIAENPEVSEDDLEIREETPETPTEDQMEGWREEVNDAVSIVDESPV